MKERRS